MALQLPQLRLGQRCTNTWDTLQKTKIFKCKIPPGGQTLSRVNCELVWVRSQVSCALAASLCWNLALGDFLIISLFPTCCGVTQHQWRLQGGFQTNISNILNSSWTQTPLFGLGNAEFQAVPDELAPSLFQDQGNAELWEKPCAETN